MVNCGLLGHSHENRFWAPRYFSAFKFIGLTVSRILATKQVPDTD